MLDEADTGFVIHGVAQGNLSLRPERARTRTAGVVLRPRFLPASTGWADWYDMTSARDRHRRRERSGQPVRGPADARQRATRAFDRNTTAGNPGVAVARYLRFDALWQHNLQVVYQLPDGFGRSGGHTNLTDQQPDCVSYATNVPISPLGRCSCGAKVLLRAVKARLTGVGEIA